MSDSPATAPDGSGPSPHPGPGPRSPPRIGLALGGGSARGLAHIAILEALDELGLKPAAIAGTSMGSICGALYAAGASAVQMRKGFVEELSSPKAFLRRHAGRLAAGVPALWSVRRPGGINSVTLLEMLLPGILRCDFAALKIPFVAVAADLYAVEEVVLDRGPLIPAIAASCAVPEWANPVVIDGRVLVDGGYINPVPFDLVRDKADIVIAVDVIGETRARPGAGMPARSEAMRGAVQILFHAVTRAKLKSAAAPDIMIRPAVAGFRSADYFRIGAILAAAEPAKEELKRKLAQCLDRAA
jgi:NTE family protein